MSIRAIRYAVFSVFLALTNSALADPIVSWDGNGHSYELVEQVTSWTDANAYAQTLTFEGQTGYLASITSAPEESFLYSSFVGAGAHAAWIGLTSDPAYGGGGNIGLAGPGAPYWAWTSGETVSYTDWTTPGIANSIPAPNNSGPGGVPEAYVEFVFDKTNGVDVGQWNDLQNVPGDGNIRYSIVEFNTHNTPEPSSIVLVLMGMGVLIASRTFRRTR